MARLKLASASPRRADLLHQVGLEFDILPSDCLGVDETPRPGEAPDKLIRRLAQEKARQGLSCPGLPADAVVLGADTAVVLDGQALGKPRDEAEFMQFMQRLAGRTHEVLTAVAVASSGDCRACLVRTRVAMVSDCADRAEAYWRSGEPVDKAGGYAIQGRGALLVERVEGSCSAVVGLPLQETAQLLEGFDIFPNWTAS